MGIIADPVLEIQLALARMGWDSPYRAGAQFVAFGTSLVKASDDIRRTYRLGMHIVIPLYTIGAILVSASVERCGGTGSILIFDHKEAKHKVNYDNRSPDLIAKSIIDLSNQVLPTFGEQLAKRINQAEIIIASLEECLVVNGKTDSWHYKGLRIDDILNAHRLVSPADRWAMYRRQANTPNTKMNLVDALSEWATTIEDPSKRFELSTAAGSMLVDRGDLEARPAWHHWEHTTTGNKYQ